MRPIYKDGKMAQKINKNRIIYMLPFLINKINKVAALATMAILICFYMQACKRNVGNPVDLKQEYFPVDIGNWIIYDVVDIRHDINHDTLNYQIKEIITADFFDNSGRLAQRVERYVRNSDTEPWQFGDVWHSIRTSRSAEKVEEDERFVKLIFPVTEFKYWDGNAYNQRVSWEYYFDSIDYAGSVGSIVYDSLAYVMQRENSNFVEYEQAFEVYAKNIGLVEKQLIDLDVRSGMIVLDSIVKGIELYQTAIDYGSN
jgi:hypothetical protein